MSQRNKLMSNRGNKARYQLRYEIVGIKPTAYKPYTIADQSSAKGLYPKDRAI